MRKTRHALARPVLRAGACILLLLACACATRSLTHEGPQAAPSPSNPRTFSVPRTAHAITVDGVLDEADWRTAPRLELLRHWEAAKPKNTGFVRILWDDAYIYFACEFADDDLYADLVEHDSMTWHNDAFEVFLKPSEECAAYYEFHVTPNGTTMDALLPGKDARRFEYAAAWESGMEAAVRTMGTRNDWRDFDEGWQAEMRIPWAAFEDLFERPRPGDRWRFVACRYDYTVRGESPIRSATALFTRLSYHRLHEYDYLEFTG